MSETHVWRPVSASIELALLELREYRDALRIQVHEFERDDPRRAVLVRVWGELEDVEHRVQEHLTRPAQVSAERPSRRMGEDTQAWVVAGGQVPMRRNRGPR